MEGCYIDTSVQFGVSRIFTVWNVNEVGYVEGLGSAVANTNVLKIGRFDYDGSRIMPYGLCPGLERKKLLRKREVTKNGLVE